MGTITILTMRCHWCCLADEGTIVKLGEIGLEPMQSSRSAVLKPWCLRARRVNATLWNQLIDQKEHVVPRDFVA